MHDNAKPYDLRDRTKRFALRTIRLTEATSWKGTQGVIGRQPLRCATSVGANYRAAKRARSAADFIAKMGIVEEDVDESLYWMELLVDTGLIETRRLQPLMEEAEELLANTVASIRTAKKRQVS